MKKNTIMVTNGGIATISERARAPVTNPGHIIGISTEISSGNSTKKINIQKPNQVSKPNAILASHHKQMDKNKIDKLYKVAK